jgi:integrase
MKSGETLAAAKSATKVQQAPPSKLSSAYWVNRVYRRSEDASSGFWWVQVQHGGKRHATSLGTSDRRVAASKAAAFYGDVRSKGWDFALSSLDPERHAQRSRSGITVGDVVRVLEAADMRTTTRFAYMSCLRWWSARHLEIKPGAKEFGRRSDEWRGKVDGVALACFTQERVERIRDKHIAGAAGDVATERRARVSVKAYLRNAKAALGAAEKLGRLTIPLPRPFAGVAVTGAVVLPYRSRIDPAALLRSAASELTAEDPDVYRVLLLALGAGLRRSEIANLRWRAVDFQSGRIWIEASGGWAPKTADSEAAVDVDPGLLFELAKYRSGPEDTVVAPDALEHAIRWLRKHGVTSNKPLHTLRKEFGSIVAHSADLLTASRQLRHSSLAVTAGVYVESRKRAAPLIGDMLKGGKS